MKDWFTVPPQEHKGYGFLSRLFLRTFFQFMSRKQKGVKSK